MTSPEAKDTLLGTILELEDNLGLAAEIGAQCTCIGHEPGSEIIRVIWEIEKSHNQRDGKYYLNRFKVIRPKQYWL